MRLDLRPFITSALAVLAPLPALAATPAPSPVPTAGPADAITIHGMDAWLSAGVWGSAVLALMIGAGLYFLARRKNATPKPVDDKGLEMARITYGFWLIIAGEFLALAVVTITVNLFRPQTPITTSDILAIVTSITGVVGTLTAAFFGIQAAGAGRSQALTALANLQSGNQSNAATFTLDPGYGPHAGNTRVSITGNGFTGATAVNFGTTPGANFDFQNDGLVRCTTPAADLTAKSDVDVVVVFPAANAQNLKVGTFYYYTVEPATGPVDGRTLVRIIGAGLTGAVAVNFGKVIIADPTFEAATGNLLVNSPAIGAPGTVDVSVTFPVEGPAKSTVVGKFEYQ